MSIKQKTAFDSWKSPITIDLMLNDSVGLGEISIFIQRHLTLNVKMKLSL